MIPELVFDSSSKRQEIEIMACGAVERGWDGSQADHDFVVNRHVIVVDAARSGDMPLRRIPASYDSVYAII